MPFEGSVMNLRLSFVVVAALATLSACGGQSPAASAARAVTPGPGVTAAPPGATEAPPPTAAPPGGGSGSSVIHVVVASGPQAGTYDGSGIKYDCNTSAGGSGASYLNPTGTEGVTTLLFTSGEGGANPAKFYFQLLFGAVSLSQPVLEIQTLDPADASGSGTASLQDNTSTIKWTIDGTTADGVDVSATVECGPVDRN
jgi:hypothetical protein